MSTRIHHKILLYLPGKDKPEHYPINGHSRTGTASKRNRQVEQRLNDLRARHEIVSETHTHVLAAAGAKLPDSPDVNPELYD